MMERVMKKIDRIFSLSARQVLFMMPTLVKHWTLTELVFLWLRRGTNFYICWRCIRFLYLANYLIKFSYSLLFRWWWLLERQEVESPPRSLNT